MLWSNFTRKIAKSTGSKFQKSLEKTLLPKMQPAASKPDLKMTCIRPLMKAILKTLVTSPLGILSSTKSFPVDLSGLPTNVIFEDLYTLLQKCFTLGFFSRKYLNFQERIFCRHLSATILLKSSYTSGLNVALIFEAAHCPALQGCRRRGGIHGECKGPRYWLIS